MKSIKVGLSTTMIEPLLTGGRLDGIGVYTQALRQYLPGFDCQVQGFLFPPLSRPQARGFSSGQALRYPYEVTALLDWAKPYAMPMDVVHVTDYRVVRMDCPVVATLHDAVPIKFPHWVTPRLRGLKNWAQKKAARKADRVIALSNYAVTELVECFGVDPARISVVYCGVDDHWRTPVASEAVASTLQQYGLQPGYFLFVGTLQPRKNVERIVQAWQALPQALRQQHPLVIVGRAGWQCETLLQQMKAAQQQGEPLHWLNNVADQTSLRHLYAGALAFVFPSLYEGFGIPVVEAFAAKVPVITANTTSLPEVSLGAALEVDPLSVDDIRHAMQNLAQDESLRQRCIDAGWQRVAKLTWQATAEQTAAVYRTALAGR